MRHGTPIKSSAEERRTLENWVRASTTEQRLVLRAHLILAAAAGATTAAIAQRFRVRPATVSQWRRRFAAQRLVGLQDRPRPGNAG
jgi:transposase